MSYSAITKEDIKERFLQYNTLYFDGALPKCAFHLIREKISAYGRYTHTRDRNGGITGHIWISNHVNWTEESLREVIVHEMIHHYLYAIKGKSGGLFGHNWRFRRECRKLKKRYGLNIHLHCLHLMSLRTW